jgi:hypothetical protein
MLRVGRRCAPTLHPSSVPRSESSFSWWCASAGADAQAAAPPPAAATSPLAAVTCSLISTEFDIRLVKSEALKSATDFKDSTLAPINHPFFKAFMKGTDQLFSWPLVIPEDPTLPIANIAQASNASFTFSQEAFDHFHMGGHVFSTMATFSDLVEEKIQPSLKQLEMHIKHLSTPVTPEARNAAASLLLDPFVTEYATDAEVDECDDLDVLKQWLVDLGEQPGRNAGACRRLLKEVLAAKREVEEMNYSYRVCAFPFPPFRRRIFTTHCT